MCPHRSSDELKLINELEIDLPASGPEMPCIRCGACAEVCPVRLQPQLLLHELRAEDFERAEVDGVFACSECGRCDPVCPSHIPLLHIFRDGKTEIDRRARQLAIADAARERFESRQRRLQREAIESAERQSERKAQVAKPDAVSAALERAKARRQLQDKDSDS
jgi:electron transport complex protein RnfC